jgi:hypothetical protein
MDAQAMTGSHLTEHALPGLQAVAWLGAGALIGGFYFLSLRWSVRMLAFGGSLLIALALQLGRLALVAVVLAAIASRFGPLPLLLTAAGILAARPAATRLGVQT